MDKKKPDNGNDLMDLFVLFTTFLILCGSVACEYFYRYKDLFL